MMTVIHLSTLKLFILIGAGFFAGIIDSVSGGGGLIVLPVLLGLGVPPVTAMGTVRFQAIVGESVALMRFVNSGGLKLNPLILPMCYAGVGSVLGSILVHCIRTDLLTKLIPILLLNFIAYSALSGRLFHRPLITLPARYFALCFGLGIGFYNGFFGPGTGALWFSAFLAFQAYSVKQAAMSAKLPNMMGNFVSLIIFASQGHLAVYGALLLSLGQIMGANLGARLVIFRGSRIIRPIFMIMVSLMAIELILKQL